MIFNFLVVDLDPTETLKTYFGRSPAANVGYVREAAGENDERVEMLQRR